MKHGTTLRMIIGLMTVYVFFVVSTIEATRPIRIHISRPDSYQTFTRETHVPDPEILVELSHKRPWKKLGLSQAQQVQIEEELRNFLLISLEIRQKMEVAVSETSYAKAAELHQQLAQRFAKHLATFYQMLTPEQRGRLAKHGKAKKTSHLLQAQTQTLLPVQDTLVMKPGAHSQPVLTEESLTDRQLLAHVTTLCQSSTAHRQRLHSIQTLRI